MAADENKVEQAIQDIKSLQSKGDIADVFSANRYSYRLTVVGSRSKEVDRLISSYQPDVQIEQQVEKGYYFLGELRPGSGVLRRQGGRPDGPGGTLTCLLESRRGSGNYFAAAGHVLSNFWRSVRPGEDGSVEVRDPKGSIYLNRRGFPATNRRRFLGDLVALSYPPRRVDARGISSDVSIDIGIVKLKGDFELKQRTTCYGSFGEWLTDPIDVSEGRSVMKCGAEETHWTAAKVLRKGERVWVYGPDRVLYKIVNQVILKALHTTKQEQEPGCSESKQKRGANEKSVNENGCPENSAEIPFAVAGDSGTMVVDCETKRPVGMLIAGSILDEEYVMTPIRPLWEFWTKQGLILRRA